MRKIYTFFLLSLILSLIFLGLPKETSALNSPNKISTSSNDNLAPAIVADSNGKVHTVWMDAPNGWGSSTTSLIHSFWNGDVWSTPSAIFTGNFHELPSLATDTSGNVHLTWDADTNPNAWQIYYSKYNGTSWSAAVAISGATAGDVAWDSEITIDSSGNPHVAYTFIPSGTVGNQRFTYYTRFNGTSWTTPVNITESGTFHQFPTLDGDNTGKVHTIWKSTAADNSTYQIVHRVWSGGTFGATFVPSGTVIEINDAEPRVTADSANNAHVVWEERITGTDDYNIKYSKWNGTSWASPFLISSVGQETTQGVPSVAILPSTIDDVLVGWIDKTTSPLKVGFRKFVASTSSWEVSRTNNIQQTSADFPVAAMDKWDNIHVAWGEINSSTSKYDLFYDAIPLAASTIGSGGGTLTTFNGDTLTIPSGSLSQNTIISAQIAPLSQTAPSGNITPPRQYIFEPTGTLFNPSLTAVFRYTDAELAGGNESTLGVYVWNSQTNAWVFKTGSINKPQNKLTVQLSSFSIYGLFASNDSAAFLPPLRVDGGNEFPQGRTIPIKFKTNEETDEPSEVKVQILEEESANIVKEFTLGQGKDSLRYETDTKQYILNLDTKPMSAGTYQINLLYKGLLKDSLDFTLN